MPRRKGPGGVWVNDPALEPGRVYAPFERADGSTADVGRMLTNIGFRGDFEGAPSHRGRKEPSKRPPRK